MGKPVHRIVLGAFIGAILEALILPLLMGQILTISNVITDIFIGIAWGAIVAAANVRKVTIAVAFLMVCVMLVLMSLFILMVLHINWYLASFLIMIIFGLLSRFLGLRITSGINGIIVIIIWMVITVPIAICFGLLIDLVGDTIVGLVYIYAWQALVVFVYVIGFLGTLLMSILDLFEKRQRVV